MTTETTTQTITTRHGPVRGAVRTDHRYFAGIPYAATPRGVARFEAPRPTEAWEQVRDVARPAPTPPQPDLAAAFAPLDMRAYFGPGWVRGQDHLTVTVWAPLRAEGAPVMVLVPGGGLAAGSAGAEVYAGQTFARDGVVLVAVNHRLGVAGFLDVPGAPRNRGLLDVLAALGWVRDNIEAFGGDPGSITLFGESAGAIVTAGVVADERAQGLLARAIVQSGSGTAAFHPDQAALVTAAAATALGVEPTLAGFASSSDDALVGALPALSAPDLRIGDLLDPLVGLNPLSLVLDEQPTARLAAGVGAGVDLIVGTNAEEGRLYLAPSGALTATTRDDLDALAAQVHPDPTRLVDAYAQAHPGATPGDLRALVLGDALFTTGSRAIVRARAGQSRARTWVYEFRWRPSALDGALGAAHTVELPFVFDTADALSLTGPAGLLGPRGGPQHLAEAMHGAWVRFATTGDPGWPAHGGAGRPVQVFDQKCGVEPDPRGALLEVWD